MRGRQLLARQLETYGMSPQCRLAPLRAILPPELAGTSEADVLSAFRQGALLRPLIDPGVADALAQLDDPAGESLRRLQEKADAICDGRFSLLGWDSLEFGHPIDWHVEPMAGRRSDAVHWSRIRYLDPAVAGDKKITWELNRHQYFITLGRAYQRTRRARYGETFVQHLSSWMDANPPKIGINWASSLEVAFRALSWVWSLDLFRHAPELTPAVFGRALQVLHAHGRHVETYLSTYFSPNTHLTGEALGLMGLGAALPGLTRAREWWRIGESILADHLSRQVRSDGVYFEQSTWYHRYTADFCIHALLLARAAHRTVHGGVAEALNRLVTPMLWMTRPDGSFPLIGDDDGGRFLAFDEAPITDWRPTLSTAAVLLGRGDCKYVAGRLAEETVWLVGPTAVTDFARVPASPPESASRGFEAGGYFVSRSDWTPRADWAVIDCGPHGTMNCGHAHADALSFELSLRGRRVLVDPGTCTYTGSSALRDRFRSVPAHNTIVVDGQPTSVPGGPFSWRRISRCELTRWVTSEAFDYFEGAHDGYRAAAGVEHRRSILHLKRRYWVIRDRLVASGRHRYESRLHFAPGLTPHVEDVCRLAVRAGDAAENITIDALGPQGRWRVEQDVASPIYGQQVVAPTAVFEWEGTGEQDLVMVLAPADGGLQTGFDQEGTSITGRDGVDRLVFGTGHVGSPGDATDGTCAWVRRAPSGIVTHAFAVGARGFVCDGLFRMTASQEVDSVWVSAEANHMDVECHGEKGDATFEWLTVPATLRINGEVVRLSNGGSLRVDLGRRATDAALRPTVVRGGVH